MRPYPILALLAFFLFVPCLPIHAQQELVWSRAIIVSSAETVPEGTVWKITNVFPNCPLQVNNHNGSADFSVVINGNTTYLIGVDTNYILGSSSLYGYSTSIVGGDHWLPAGTQLEPGSCVWGISVIEFLVQ